MPLTKSKIWLYFERDGPSLATCKVCFKTIKTSGNTSNMLKHLKVHKHIHVHHVNETSEEPHSPNSTDTNSALESISSTDEPSTSLETAPKKRKTFSGPLDSAFKAIDSFAAGGTRHSKITNAILYFICKDNRPFHVVQGLGFRRMLKELAPLYKIPHSDTFKHKLDLKYDALKNLYKEKFFNICNFSITCDIWTETMSMRSFLGVTCHYIEDGKLCSTTIEVHELSDRHTGNYIGEQLLDILSKWNIDPQKIAAVVTDSAQNMVNAVNSTFDKQRHIPCFAHLLNLVVENIFSSKSQKEIPSDDSDENNRTYLVQLIEKVRTIVKWVKNSVIASDELRKIQIRNGVLEGQVKKFILDVSTRWNSRYYMLERFVELAEIVNELLLNKPHAPPMLTAVEMLEVKEILIILKPIEHMTVEASGEQYITISKIIPMLSCAANLLNSFQPELPIARQLKINLEQQLKRRFEKIEFVSLIAVATILDPRFKNIHFQNPIAAADAIRHIRNDISKSTIPVESPSSSQSCEAENEFWSHHETLAQQNCAKQNNSSKDELSLYLSGSLVSLKSDPLEEWEKLKQVFPLLHEQALKYFSIVGTSVPAERLFSKAGMTISQSRNRLLGKRVTKLLFLGSVKEEYWE